jgi:hypothetical protein
VQLPLLPDAMSCNELEPACAYGTEAGFAALVLPASA